MPAGDYQRLRELRLRLDAAKERLRKLRLVKHYHDTMVGERARRGAILYSALIERRRGSSDWTTSRSSGAPSPSVLSKSFCAACAKRRPRPLWGTSWSTCACVACRSPSTCHVFTAMCVQLDAELLQYDRDADAFS
jgi:hypothetical protein